MHFALISPCRLWPTSRCFFYCLCNVLFIHLYLKPFLNYWHNETCFHVLISHVPSKTFRKLLRKCVCTRQSGNHMKWVTRPLRSPGSACEKSNLTGSPYVNDFQTRDIQKLNNSGVVPFFHSLSCVFTSRLTSLQNTIKGLIKPKSAAQNTCCRNQTQVIEAFILSLTNQLPRTPNQLQLMVYH